MITFDTSQPIRWLRLSSEIFEPSRETFEYRLKGPLYAASAVFTRTAAPDAKSVTTSGSLSAKLPFGKTWSLTLESTSSTLASVSFVDYKEIAESRTIFWRASERGLFLRTDQSSEQLIAAPEDLHSLPGQLLSSVDVLSALRESFVEDTTMYGAYFLAGQRLFALRIWPSMTSGELHAAFVTADPRDTGAEAFCRLNWSDARRFDLTWDQEARVARSFRLRLSPFGQLESRLTVHRRD